MRLRWSLRGTRMPAVVVTMVAATIVIAACADGPQITWGGSQQTAARTPTENSSCRAFAKQKSEQEFAIVQSSGPAIGYSRTTAYDQQVDRYDAQRREQQLYNDCVKRRSDRQPEPEPDPTEQSEGTP